MVEEKPRPGRVCSDWSKSEGERHQIMTIGITEVWTEKKVEAMEMGMILKVM